MSYYSTGTDHTSLGTDGSFEIIGPFTASDGTRQPPFVRIFMHGRWIYDTPGPSGPPAKGKPGAGITFSADTGTFTLDADLARVPKLVSGKPFPVTGHVKGTIVCRWVLVARRTVLVRLARHALS